MSAERWPKNTQAAKTYRILKEAWQRDREKKDASKPTEKK